MDTTVETKEDFIAAASSGLPRVADAIIATPPEARIGVIDAVMESYRKLAGEFLGEEETEKWLVSFALIFMFCSRRKMQTANSTR
jgi:hypothetical protein